MNLNIPDLIIDFSANINPLGPPKILKENWLRLFEKVIDYPDPYTSTLQEKISLHEQIDKNFLLIGNGGAELINLVARMLTNKRVLLIQPTFSEYEQSCKTSNCSIVFHQLHSPNWELNGEDLVDQLQDVNALFLCNPNNPTGVQYSQATIVRLIKLCKEKGCHLILDEAFYDMTETYDSIVPFVKEYSNLVVIRSMTKMFAVPGLRLGYAIAHPAIIDELSSYQPHWSVNSIALAAADLCLQDTKFIGNTQEYITNERKKLFSFYQREGLVLSPSRVNFYLLKDPGLKDQLPLFRFLLERGIVPRHTVNFPGLKGSWLRFAIKSSADNNQLMEVIKEWKKRRP